MRLRLGTIANKGVLDCLLNEVVPSLLRIPLHRCTDCHSSSFLSNLSPALSKLCIILTYGYRDWPGSGRGRGLRNPPGQFLRKSAATMLTHNYILSQIMSYVKHKNTLEGHFAPLQKSCRLYSEHKESAKFLSHIFSAKTAVNHMSMLWDGCAPSIALIKARLCRQWKLLRSRSWAYSWPPPLPPTRLPQLPPFPPLPEAPAHSCWNVGTRCCISSHQASPCTLPRASRVQSLGACGNSTGNPLPLACVVAAIVVHATHSTI